jgi:IS30 family transposase
MRKETIESTNKLLRVIIALILKRKDPDTFTLRQQIEILNDLGLKPLEIAEILGRSNTYINKEISRLRKSRKGKE